MDIDPKPVEVKIEPDEDYNPPPDLKMKQKLVEDDPLYEFDPPRYWPMEISPESLQDLEISPNADGFRVPSKGKEREFDYVAETSKRTDSSSSFKRTRITKPKSPEVIDVSADTDSDQSFEVVKLLEEIVGIYSGYISHILQMAKDRFRDEHMWNFDTILCTGLAENFEQRIKRLEWELETMKKESNQAKNYSLIEPRARQIMSELMAMQERLDRSPNIGAAAKKNCTKDILMYCIDEIDQLRKELHGMTLRIGEMKTMKMHGKTMAIKQENFRI